MSALESTKRKSDSIRNVDWLSAPMPATSVGYALQRKLVMKEEQLARLHRGIRVNKVNSTGKLSNRVLTISKDNFAVFCTHNNIGNTNDGASFIGKKLPIPFISKKGIAFGHSDEMRQKFVRYIDVADITHVHTSVVATQTLEKARSGSRLRGVDSTVDSNRDQIVTITHHGAQTLDFLISNENDRQAVVDCIKQMIRLYQEAKKHVDDEALLLRYTWYDVDSDRNSLISEDEFEKILARVNIYQKHVAQAYRNFVKERKITTKGGLKYSECMLLLQKCKLPEKVKKTAADEIWDSVFGATTEAVDQQTFLEKFLEGVQGESSYKLAGVKSLFSQLNDMEVDREEKTTEPGLTRARFEAFLTSEINDAYDPKAQVLKRSDMNNTLSAYWINSSHNTYSTGDQLQSPSSVACYMKAMQRGCKCLELDCWDGEPPDKTGGKVIPVVYHGFTLTSKLAFVDIIRAVRAYIDQNPDTYPIILSLENHCSHPFQRRMADTMVKELKDYLYIPTKDAAEKEPLPSPEALRGKVLIKGKRPPEPDDAPIEEEVDVKKKLPKTVPELTRITLFNGVHFKSFEKSIDLPPPHMHSIGETKIPKIIDKKPTDANLWRQYNVSHLTRTYPAGHRVDSSNYNPLLAWSLGCQLVALNFQTNDTPLILNDGMFRQNGECGYVLKPESIMGTAALPNAPLKLMVRVLGGSCLPKPNGATSGETIDPYVIVTVHDVRREGKNKKEVYASESHNTEPVDDNGFCPVWNESGFKTFNIHNPDVAMLEFTVNDEDFGLDDHVAVATIPFRCLRRGFRCVRLFDHHGTRTGPFGFATLLVEIQIQAEYEV